MTVTQCVTIIIRDIISVIASCLSMIQFAKYMEMRNDDELVTYNKTGCLPRCNLMEYEINVISDSVVLEDGKKQQAS
jgi:hypothetical protein